VAAFVGIRTVALTLLVDEPAAHPVPNSQIADRLRSRQYLDGQVLTVTLRQPRCRTNTSIHLRTATEKITVPSSTRLASIRLHLEPDFEPRRTSTEILLKGMGICRQSMYDTFGDKHRIYLEALRRYSSDSTAEIIGVMLSQPSALKGLEAALLAFASRPATLPKDGCLGVSASTEFGRSDPEICAITDAAGATMSAAFERIIRKGQAEGDFAGDLDPRIAAQFLSSTLLGLKVSARAGATPATLQGIARLALKSLR
jgi:TetR/AcrR family transcriptional regulator, transcriptional repressor for nem operon